MTSNDVLPLAFAALLLSGLLLLAYRHDIRDARLYTAMRKAAQHPYADRDFHRDFALRHGLFWGPCPLCEQPFGGQEMTGKTVPHPDPVRTLRGERQPVCPPCSLGLRAPAPSSSIKEHHKFRTPRQ